MSALIDERIVEMSFDNKNFEKNVKTSMNTIDDLKSSLNFSNTSSSMNKTLNSLDTSGIVSGLQAASKGFSTMEIAAISAIANITNRVVDLGIQLVKSLSLDNISAGWGKYAEKTTSVATLVAQGYELETVDNSLEKLLWFTDETSYSFTDMVSNISKFTAAGQGLEDSVQAMMGIANWAALSGQNATTASRAMYQLSQAMSQGSVKLADWKSIQNANMDTQEFRQKALDAAVAAGELSQAIDGTYTTKAGNDFDINQFTLHMTSDGWFTTDVLMAALGDYSSAVDTLYDKVQSDDSISTTSEAIAKYGDELDAFGLKAFRSAQEAKTFADVISATKDAVGSQWMTTFESMFGNYDEAKVLWTDLANELWEVFAGGLAINNEILSGWKELGGRDDIFANTEESTGAFWNLFYAIVEIKDAIGEAWNAIFPKKTAEELKNFTERLKELTAGLRLSEDGASKLTSVFKGIFSVLKVFINLLKGAWIAIQPIIKVVLLLANQIFTALGYVGGAFSNFAGDSNAFINAGQGIANILTLIINKVVSFVKMVGQSAGFNKVVTVMTNAFNQLLAAMKNFFNGFKKVDTSGLDEFNEDVVEKFNPLEVILKGLANLFSGLWSVLKAVLPVLGKTIEFVGIILKTFAEKLTGIFGGDGGSTLTKILSMAFLATIIKAIIDFIYMFKDISDALVDVLGSVSDVLHSKAMMQYAEALKTMAIGILILVAALLLISMMDDAALKRSLTVLLIMIGTLVAVVAIMKKITETSKFLGAQSIITAWSMKMTADAMLKIAISVAVLALALRLLATMDQDELMRGLIGLTMIMALLLGASAIIGKNEKIFKKGAKGLISMALAVLILSIPLKKIGSMDTAQLIQGVLGVSAMVGLCILFAKISGKVKKAVSAAMGMILFAQAILMASIAMRIIGGMGWSKLAVGIVGITAIAGVMILLGSLSKYMQKAILSAIAMVIVSASLIEVAIALTIFGAVKWSSILKAMVTLAGIFAILALVTKVVSTKMIASMILLGVALIPLSIGLTMLAGAFAAIALVPWKSIMKTLGVLALILVIGGVLMSIGGLLMPFMILASGALIAMSIGLIMLAGAMTLIGAVPWKSIGKTMLVLVGVLVVLGIAAILLQSAVPVLLSLSMAMLVMSAAILIISLALSMFVVSIGLFGAAIGTTLKLVIQALIEAAPMMAIAIGAILSAIFQGLISAMADLFILLDMLMSNILLFLIKHGPTIIDTVIFLLDSLLASLAAYFPTMIDSIISLVVSLLEGIRDNIDTIVNVLIDILINLINTLAKRIPDLMDAWVNLIVQMLQAVGTNLKKIIDAMFKLVVNILESVADAFYNKAPALINALFDVVKGIAYALGYTVGKSGPEFVSIGTEMINGIIKGLVDGLNNLVNSVKDVAASAWNGFKNFFGIKSPSKLMAEMGMYIDQGLAEGIKGNSKSVINSAESLGDGVVDGLENSGIPSAIQSLYKSLDNDMDSEIVIRPVMDLTDIQNGTNQIFGMMNNVDGYSINGSNDIANQTAYSIRNGKKQIIEETSNNKSGLNNEPVSTFYNTFTINDAVDPTAVANKVSEIMQTQINRRRVQYGKSNI